MKMQDLLDMISFEKKKKQDNTIAMMAVGMGVAAALGVAVGMLIAPKPGREMRRSIKNKAVDAVDTSRFTVMKKPVFDVEDFGDLSAEQP